MTKTGKPKRSGGPEQTKAPKQVADPRTKSERHGKVTADKWNQ